MLMTQILYWTCIHESFLTHCTIDNNEPLRWWGSSSIYKAEREEITDFPSFQNRNLQTPLHIKRRPAEFPYLVFLP
ncbi:hypothetical protein VNO78_31213 [Psophocarpus tetragonolobus]|uniref:Uncharacterized protein n=1 Tax=Psophocarpus tetragonolobus TaxID=3891 RepID=A0AAN9RY91_PSOTE